MIDWLAVEIGDDHVANLRLFLQDGPQVWQQLQQEMTTDQAAAPYIQMLQAAFAVAVGRRFSSTYTIHEIVRYIAKLRTEFKEYSGEDFDPRLAENAIRTAIGDPSLRYEDKTDAIEDVAILQNLTTVQMVILFDLLLADEESSEGRLDDFVQDTVEVARRWVLERQATQT